MAGLYIHIPFCHSKCAYCDFYSLPRFEKFSSDFFDSLEKEWHLRKNEISDIGTIYFGGGTPSMLSAEHIKRVGEWLPINENIAEFTVEMNPEDVKPERLKAWKSIGVNRVSMGVQSLNDDELKTVGRRHTANEAIRAYKLLRRYFDNVSVDVIIGLPGQTVSSLDRTLKNIILLKPEHISAYILSYEPGTKLKSLLDTGKIISVPDEIVSDMYLYVCEALKQAGFCHYEISNFCLPGFEARHNSSYWTGEQYLGLGPAAHSYDGTVRRYNPSNIREWIKCLKSSLLPYVVENEELKDRINNRIMTGLRTAQGFNLDEFPEKEKASIVLNLERLPHGRVVVEGNNVRIPEKMWLLSDDTIGRLFLE